MPAVSQLKIIIPGICGPLAEVESLRDNTVVNTWLGKISRAHQQPSEKSFTDVVKNVFHFELDADFPSATLSLFNSELFDPSKHYMHADPVHLRADMDQAVLTSSYDLEITDSEAEVLCSLLNQHFEQDGLRFFYTDKDNWFVASEHKMNMSTTPLVDATGRNINFLLPSGDDSPHWRKILTEAQMLLHSHDVNQSREAAGRLSINSLWLHGCGDLKSSSSSGEYRLCSDDGLMSGLAAYLACEYIKIPDLVDAFQEYLLSSGEDSSMILHLADLEHLTNYTDTGMWLNQLQHVLENWVYPLLAFSYKQGIKVSLYDCNGKEYIFSKYDFLKFWRGAALEEYIDSY